MLITFFSTYGRLFAADGGGSGGAGEDDDPDERVRSEDIIARSRNDAETIARLGRELDRNEDRRFKLRESRRTLTQELVDLRGKQPGEGATVLTSDQAKVWEAYQGLGKVEDLTKAVKERDDLAGELGTFRRNAALQAAAEAHDYRPTALAKLPSLAGKGIETREIEVDGQKVKRAFVKDGDKEFGLAEYIQQHDAEFLPALTAESGGAGGTQQRNGKPYPAQQSNTTGQRRPETAGAAHVQKTRYALPGKEK